MFDSKLRSRNGSREAMRCTSWPRCASSSAELGRHHAAAAEVRVAADADLQPPPAPRGRAAGFARRAGAAACVPRASASSSRSCAPPAPRAARARRASASGPRAAIALAVRPARAARPSTRARASISARKPGAVRYVAGPAAGSSWLACARERGDARSHTGRHVHHQVRRARRRDRARTAAAPGRKRSPAAGKRARPAR